MISLQIIIIFLGVFNASIFEVLSSDSNPCHPKYASQTKTTNECICLSRNCEGPKCQSSQGFVWYNYLHCPTCQCLPPKVKAKPAELNIESEPKSPEVQQNTQLEPEPEQPPIKNTQKRQPSVSSDKSIDEEETWHEWLIDNVNTIFAFCTGMVVVIIIALYLFMSVGGAVQCQQEYDEDKLKNTDANKNSKSALTFAKASDASVTKDDSKKS